jgi:hypothetical protein
MSDAQKHQYSDLDTQDKEIQRQIDSRGRDIKPFTDDDTGKLIISGNARAEWVKKQQSKQDAIRLKKKALVGDTTPATAGPIAIPDGADGAWDPIQKKVIYKTK